MVSDQNIDTGARGDAGQTLSTRVGIRPRTSGATMMERQRQSRYRSDHRKHHAVRRQTGQHVNVELGVNFQRAQYHHSRRSTDAPFEPQLAYWLALIRCDWGYGPAIVQRGCQSSVLQQFADQPFFVQINHRCGNTPRAKSARISRLRILSSRKRVPPAMRRRCRSAWRNLL